MNWVKSKNIYLANLLRKIWFIKKWLKANWPLKKKKKKNLCSQTVFEKTIL